MNTTLEGIIVACCLWIVPNIIGILPRFVQPKKYPHAFTLLGCVSAGVFLSLLLCHIVPEACEVPPASDRFFSAGPHEHGSVNYGLFLSGVIFLAFMVVDGVYGHSMIDGHDHAHGHHHHHHHHDDGLKKPNGSAAPSGSSARAFILVGILSLHSALEGLMPIRLSVEFPALLIHKMLEIIAIGSAVMRLNCSSLVYFALIAFSSLLTPIAHIIFVLVNSNLSFNIMSIFQGLSLGAVVYATFGECIPHEMEKESPSAVCRIGYIACGYLGATLIAMLTPMLQSHHH